MHRLRIVVRSLAIIALIPVIALGMGLPRGHHTVHLKYWPRFKWHVTNFTPYELDYRIGNLTPDGAGGLWFSVGNSIEHIGRDLTIRTFPMHEYLWRVSGIALAGSRTWFSIGQSGKVGVIDQSGRLKLIQVVLRRNFPDLRDIVVKRSGEMWFLDFGRRSIGYRSASGRVVENPLPDVAFPYGLVHCMGRLWVAAAREHYGSPLGVIGQDFKLHWISVGLPLHSDIRTMACDSADRLWMSVSSSFRATRSPPGQWPPKFITRAYIARIDRSGHLKEVPFAQGISGGQLAADSRGGVWLTNWVPNWSRFLITHVTANGSVHAYHLPVDDVFGGGSIAVAPGGILWLAMNEGNSAIAVTRLN